MQALKPEQLALTQLEGKDTERPGERFKGLDSVMEEASSTLTRMTADQLINSFPSCPCWPDY